MTGTCKRFDDDGIRYTSEWNNDQFIKGEGQQLQKDGSFKVFKAIYEKDYELTY